MSARMLAPSQPHHSSSRHCRRGGLRTEGGFTLVEVLVAAVVLVGGLTTLLGLLSSSVKASFATHQREQATNLARQILEDARGIPYAQISPTSIVAQLQALPGLTNQGSGSSWQLVRGKTTYTVALKECPIDDGKGEEWGVHVNAAGENPYCKDTGEKEWVHGERGPDPQPEDLKRITVDVTWSATGRAPDVRQVETLSAAGAAPGLSATNLKLEVPAVPDAGTSEKPVITKATTTLLTFSVSSPTGTAAMRWSLEGIPQATPPVLKQGTTWSFSWSIPDPGISDGTYTIAVQAIDKRGVLGPPVSIPATLIRNIPAPVTELKGGFNKINVPPAGVSTPVVELQWLGNSERNIVGYRVYRPGGTLGTESGLACPSSLATLSTATTCIDFSPPAYNAANLAYEVVALYRNVKNEVAEGTPKELRIVPGPPLPPNEPTVLEVSHNEEGAVVLKWKAPSGGETPIFYRIYRGSTNYTSRYDIATGTTYTDTDATEPHTYWVTAVDANLTESSFLGSVTG